MKYRYSFILFAIFFIIQSTVLNHLSVFGVTANLILCAVIAFSFLYEDYNGLINGIIFGMLLDLCFSPIVGIAALCNMVIALYAMEMKRYLYKESLVSILIVSFSGTIIYQLIYWGLGRMFDSPISFIYVAKLSGVLLLYNGIALMLIYFFMRKHVIKHRKDRYIYKGYTG